MSLKNDVFLGGSCQSGLRGKIRVINTREMYQGGLVGISSVKINFFASATDLVREPHIEKSNTSQPHAEG